MVRPTWWISQVIPPALLTYFGRTLYVCLVEVGPSHLPALGYRSWGKIYSLTALLLIPSISVLFLRLYFLPSNQSVPPRDPPASITRGSVIFECLSPAEAKAVRAANGAGERDEEGEALVNRCWRGKCGGRWKPARARHCSECGVCRMAFDHHCSFFANCLTAPHIPTFMCLLAWTPPTIVLLSSPLYLPLARRAMQAYRLSWADEAIRTWWYGWRWSWVVAGGPVGRYVGGVILGWKRLDREDGGGMVRLEVGILVGVGICLALITAALGVATARVVQGGYLTIDRERARSLARATHAVNALRKAGRPVPPETILAMERWVDKHYFWVPDPSAANGGRVVEHAGEPGPYDRGHKGNWELIMGKGAGWLLPWTALQRGVDADTALNWPLSEMAEKVLRSRGPVAQ